MLRVSIVSRPLIVLRELQPRKRSDRSAAYAVILLLMSISSSEEQPKKRALNFVAIDVLKLLNPILSSDLREEHPENIDEMSSSLLLLNPVTVFSDEHPEKRALAELTFEVSKPSKLIVLRELQLLNVCVIFVTEELFNCGRVTDFRFEQLANALAIFVVLVRLKEDRSIAVRELQP